MAHTETSAPGPDNLGWHSCSFGPFEFFPAHRLLLRDGLQVRVGARTLQLLKSLLRRAGEVVAKEELISQVWPNYPIDDASLRVNMSALRRALGEGNDSALYIGHVMGIGFRFTSAVRFVADQLSRDSTPPAARGMPNNLPILTTRILGRSDVVESISRNLAVSHLVSIVGAGGVGKTTVAIAVAERFLVECHEGVWFVDLAAIKDLALLPGAIAVAVGGSGQQTSSVEALCEQLREKQLLLVLDNCEHLVGAVAACASRILASASGVRILVTSREPLMLSGERVHRLPALDVPPVSSTLRAREALKFSAIQLFVERAAESYEAFEFTDAEALVVADICRRLDGLALAIELAASRIEAFGVCGLQKQLEDSRLPLSFPRSGPVRHRTLHATIEWSYGLLPEHEAQMLRAVSVFSGSFDAEGAAAVADIPVPEAIRCVMQLSVKSLLSVDFDEERITYRLLQTTRAFCLDRLRHDISRNLIVQRHARYICELINRSTSEWTQRRNQKLGANYDRALTDLYKALCTSTVVSHASQDIDAMRRAAEIASDLGDLDSQVRTLQILGVCELFIGEPRLAWSTFEKLATVVALQNPGAMSECETLLGVTELFLGRLEASRTRLEKLYEEELRRTNAAHGGKQTVADAAWTLPHPRWLTGEPDGAARLALAEIHHTTRLADKTVLKNNVLTYAVPVLYWCGLDDECRRHASEMKAHCESYGFLARRPIAMLYLAALACRESSDAEEHILIMQDSIRDLRAANNLARMPYHLCLLAEGLWRQQRFEESELIIDASIEVIEAHGEAWCLPEVLRVRAAIFFGRQDQDGAEAILLMAMKKARDIGALSWELRAANDLASIWIRQRRLVDAREMLTPIFKQFREGHGTRDLKTAAKLLREVTPP